MKRMLPMLAITGLLATFTPTTGRADDKPMHPAVAQLDLDGDVILFLNTDTIEQRVYDYIDQFSSILLAAYEGQTPGPEYYSMMEGINKVKAAIEWSGLLSIDSYALSTAPVEGTLSRTISISSHSDADAGKPLWRLLATAPKSLQGIGYAPADSVYMVNSTIDLGEVWKIINEAIAELLDPEEAAAVNQQIAMAGIMLGTNVSDIVDSIDNEILLTVQLSEEKQFTTPSASQPVTLPEPSFVIGLQTRRPLLQQIILQQLKQAGMPTVESQHGGYTLYTLNLPVPAPFPVAPTLVQTKDYLLIGSNPEVVSAALDSKTGGSGLIANPLYRKLLSDAPAETSSIEFLSPRFMHAYVEIMKQCFAGADANAGPMVDMFIGAYANLYSGGYSLKTPTGIYSKCYADYGGAKPIELFVNAYFGAISSAVAIPLMSGNKDRAMTTEAQAGCTTIATALRVHWVEHGSFEGIATPWDLELIQHGDLDGTYFKEAGYTMDVLTDGQNYTISAQGSGAAAGKRVTMTVVDGGTPTWDIQ